MATSWDEVTNSAEYANTLQRLQAQLAGRFRAVPAASAEVQTLTQRAGAEQARLHDIGQRLALGERAIGVRQGALDLATREQRRDERRLPIATGLGLAGVGISALGAYGGFKQAKRSETLAGQLEQTQQAGFQTQAQGIRDMQDLLKQQIPLYNTFLQQYPVSPALGG